MYRNVSNLVYRKKVIDIVYYKARKRYYSSQSENSMENRTTPINNNYLIIPENKDIKLIRSITSKIIQKKMA